MTRRHDQGGHSDGMKTLVRLIVVVTVSVCVALGAAIGTAISGVQLELLPDTWSPRAVAYFTVVTAAVAAFTLAMFAGIAATPRVRRAGLTQALHVIVTIVGTFASIYWVFLLVVALGYLGLIFILTVALQTAATVFLYRSLGSDSRRLAAFACCLGIAGGLVPNASPTLAAAGLGLASAFAVVLFATAMPRPRIAATA